MKDKLKESEWRKRLTSWKDSGFSGQRWCRESNTNYHQFLYWKLQLIGRNDQQQVPFAKGDFHELSDDEDVSSGIFIECSGVVIRLGKKFDPNTLKKCISTLRMMSC